jgi:hypothetical protein
MSFYADFSRHHCYPCTTPAIFQVYICNQLSKN